MKPKKKSGKVLRMKQSARTSFEKDLRLFGFWGEMSDEVKEGQKRRLTVSTHEDSVVG